MRHTLRRTALGCALIVAATVCTAIPRVLAAGDAKSGLELARQWCASCHNVEPDATLSDKAPPFAVIAQKRDEDWIEAWLSDPHPPMTGIALSRMQIDDVTAYIKSLAKP